ncbi:MAG TPA: glutamate-5-semialdehyde dehydrogenase [Caulobacteraceae bacterium]|jgi:glutamate-5-semialdehyde dehydrogenase
MTLAADMQAMGQAARAAAHTLARAPAAQRTDAIAAAGEALRRRAGAVLAANAADLAAATAAGVAAPMLRRLELDRSRIEAMAMALESIAAQRDPLGAELARWTRPNGLDICRVSTPIGVLAIIFESRPNVAADAAALCLRSGNAAILRGGSEAQFSVRAIHAAIEDGLAVAGLPREAIQLVPTADRAAVGHLLNGLDGAIDLIIPRGGKTLVARVAAEAHAPVLGHLEGLCHTYVHAAADGDKARAIVLDAKVRNVSVCGATETLLVDRAIAPALLPVIADDLRLGGCELRGDADACALVPAMSAATEADWATEYLAPILAVRVVEGLDEAVAHVQRWGSGHTDAIVSEDPVAAERFAAEVDSAIVLVNASTQFADGGEFGFGAEIGISTSKLHARGPVGAEQLTTYKYVVRGSGQTRG